MRFIHDWVITGIQWMVHWWGLVHCGRAAEFEHVTHGSSQLAINPNISVLVLWHKLDLYLKNNIWNNFKISSSLSMCTFCVEDAALNSIFLSLFSLLLFGDSHNWCYNFTKNMIEWDMQHHQWHKVTYTDP